MFDDDKSIDAQLICNQFEGAYNKLRGMNSMSFIASWDNYGNKRIFTNMKM